MTPEAQTPPFSPERLGNPAFMDDGSEAPARPDDEELTPLQRKLREQGTLIAEKGSAGKGAPGPAGGEHIPPSSMTAAALRQQMIEAHPSGPLEQAVPSGAGGMIPMTDVPPAPAPGFGESAAGLPPRPHPPGFAEVAAGLSATTPKVAGAASTEASRNLQPLPTAGPALPGLVPPVAVPPLAPLTPTAFDLAVPDSMPPVEDDSGREVAPSDVMPIIGGGRTASVETRGNRRKQGGALRVIAAVLLVQALLGGAFLAVMYYSPPFRVTVRKFFHRVLGTSAVVAQAEPRWIPLDPSLAPSPIASGDPMSFEKIGTLEENVEDIQRFLGVTSKEALSEISQLKDRNQLTRLADEAITRGSRSAYMQLSNIAETSRETAQINGARAELLRVKFFFASGTRSASFLLPMATLYPEVKSKKEEQLTQTELIALLLDSEKDWRVRRRVAFLLGDKRSYDVAESLAEAIRSDPSLDVIKESVFSFEAITGYRSPDLFEMKDLLDWWDLHAVEVKKTLGA